MTDPRVPNHAAVAEMAANRFLTPDRPALRPEDVLLLEHATRRFTVEVEGQRVEAMVWGDGGPTALLVHGWSSRAVHLAALIRHFSARGFQVVAFDALAHGASGGERSSVRHHAASLLAVARQLPSVDIAVAHSVGSPALFLAIADGLEVGASVHLAGPVSLRRTCLRVADAYSLPAAVREGFLHYIETFAALPLAHAEDERLVAGVRHPVLLVHDPKDAEVPFEESVIVQRYLPQSQLTEVPGAGHRRIIGDSRTLAAVDAFLEAQGFVAALPILPS